MCKEMPGILVDKGVDKKRIIGKMDAKEEERHKGYLPPHPEKSEIFQNMKKKSEKAH
jgi:hypothetical protein